jgi:tRNA(Ile)-lysidine synthase
MPRQDLLLCAIQQSNLVGPGDRVLVAVSGGPDSTALLLALRESGLHVVAAHYDHALREGSEVVAQQVAALCARLDVELIRERRTVPMPKGSVQAGARALRYAFLERGRALAGADAVALAHTADDLVEGVVLHLLRGCGLAGFRGMPARRDHYVRPLLHVWRSEVLEFLERREVAFHEDPANVDPHYARVRARLQILPAMERDRPGILRRIHAGAVNAATWHESVVAQASGLLGSGPLMTSDLDRISEPVKVEALRLMYTRAGGPEPGLSRAHLDSMLRLARPGRGGRGVDLPGGLRFRIVGGSMQVTAARSAVPAARQPVLEVADCSGCDEPGAAHVRMGLSLHVGHRRPGLRLRPVGGPGTRKLQDVFVDAHVPREERDAWPLVFAGEKLAWVPGVALDADLASGPGKAGLHVTLSPMPVRFQPKVARLETPSGEPS